jgi:DNA-binding transcriptional LysR family regulator
VRLFERTREGLRITRAAEQAFAAAEAMETAHAQLTRDASDVETAAEGTVRLTVDPGLAEAVVAPALVRLRAAHPRVDVELDASPLPRDLARREADLALRSIRVTGAELIMTKVSTQRWLALGAPGLVEQLGALAAWADAPWITWDRDMTGFAPAQWVARHAGKASVPLRTSHFASQIAAAEAGLGLALLPAMYTRLRELRPVKLKRALAAAADEWPTGEMWLVSHRMVRDVPRVAAVWSFLAAELRAIGG